MISSGLLLYSPERCSVAHTRKRVTCVCKTGLKGILDTMHILVYIPSNKSEFDQYAYTLILGDVVTVIVATMLVS